MRSGLFKAIRIDGNTATAVDLALLIDSIEVRFVRFAPFTTPDDENNGGRLFNPLQNDQGFDFAPAHILSGTDSVAGDLWRPGQVGEDGIEHPFDEQPLGIEMYEAFWVSTPRIGSDPVQRSAEFLVLRGEDGVQHLLFISGDEPERYDDTQWIAEVVPAGFNTGEEAISFSFFEATSFQRLLLQDSMEDFYGVNAFETGESEDTVAPHGGTDIIDLGEDPGPGGEDFDTVIFDDISGNSGGIVVRAAQGLVLSKDNKVLRVEVSGIEEIVGSGFADRFSGSTGDDRFDGAGGNDVIRGRGGDDVFFGGDGDDDIQTKGTGTDHVEGGAGADRIRVLGGDDHAEGGAGMDILRGGAGNDTLLGDEDDDRLFGQGGDDRLEGGSGADFLEGGNGRDVLIGGFDADVLRGGASNDILIGGDGDDRLYGGAGRDTFVFAKDDHPLFYEGTDRIKDWEDGLDQLDLTDFGIDGSNFTFLLSVSSQGTDIVRIELPDSFVDETPLGVILIENMQLAQLSADDFA